MRCEWAVVVVAVGLLGCLASATSSEAVRQAPLQPIRRFNTTDHVKADGCKPGFWGGRCVNTCASPACVAFPNGDDEVGIACDKATGRVRYCDVCKPGYWGEDCSLLCASSENCVVDPTLYPVACDKLDGENTVCSRCKEGFTGQNCMSPVTCPPLPSIPNGKSSCAPGLKVGLSEQCVFSCDDGFELDGVLTTKCVPAAPHSTIARWTDQPPTCVAKQCAARSVPGSYPCIGVTGSFCKPKPLPGQVCVGAFHCEGQPGTDLGIFVPLAEEPRCVDVAPCGECDEHASCRPMHNRSVCVCNSGYFGSGAKGGCQKCATCEKGFHATKQCGVVFAGANTTLTSHDTVCEDVDECVIPCPNPDALGCNNCAHKCHNEKGFFTCSCQEGYRLAGDAHTCLPTRCEMHHMHHARRACAGIVGTMCTAESKGFCEPGFVGKGALVCSPSGEWSGDAGCYAMKCGATGQIEHIDTSQPCEESQMRWDSEFALNAHSECTLRCQPGFRGTGKIRCSPKENGVVLTTDAICEPDVCDDFFVVPSLSVKCSGIKTGEDCVAGTDFQCPNGFIARGSASCQASGNFQFDAHDPARCEELPNDPCLASPCVGGKCTVGADGASFSCSCPNTHRLAADRHTCRLRCPVPAVANEAGTDCVYPSGFRRVVLSPGAAPSAVMVGQHEIQKKFKPAEIECDRVAYEHNFNWQEFGLPRVLVSVHHPNGRVGGDVVDHMDHPAFAHWVENVTSTYFTFCMSELYRTGEAHDTVVVSYLAFTRVQGAEAGESEVGASSYTIPSTKKVLTKYVGLERGFRTTPLVFATLAYSSVASEGGDCDPTHCNCEVAVHNAALLGLGSVFADAFGAHYSDLPRYRKLRSEEMERQIAMDQCGRTRCSECGESCSSVLHAGLGVHAAATCPHGNGAKAVWLATTEFRTSTLWSGSELLPYQKLGVTEWRELGNCHTIEFGKALVSPVVFATVNHQTGETTGAFVPLKAPLIASHIEGVSQTSFRFCYKLALTSYDEQPQSQPGFVSVDWIAFHRG